MVPSNGMCIGVTPNGVAGSTSAVHALGHRVRDDVGGERVGAGRQMRAVLLDAAAGQDHQRVLLELRGDLRLRQVGEIAARQHGGFLRRAARARRR